ncbi:hypothetical protein ACQJBY_066582 [Aegilops geniculata]
MDGPQGGDSMAPTLGCNINPAAGHRFLNPLFVWILCRTTDPTSPPAIQSYLVCVLLQLVLEESGAHPCPSSNGGKPCVCSFISPKNLSSSIDGGWADSDGLTPESRVAASAEFPSPAAQHARYKGGHR